MNEKMKFPLRPTYDTSTIASLPFPDNLPDILDLVIGQDGKIYSIQHGSSNQFALPLRGKESENIIRQEAAAHGYRLKRADLNEVVSFLEGYVEASDRFADVYYRVAPWQDGVELDIGDETHTRVRISPGKVELINEGSETLFYRTSTCLAMALPLDYCR